MDSCFSLHSESLEEEVSALQLSDTFDLGVVVDSSAGQVAERVGLEQTGELVE